MIMKAEILRLLRETDGYVSGQELCNQFGVSRTAVWKAINQLKEAGYEIEAVQGVRNSWLEYLVHDVLFFTLGDHDNRDGGADFFY